MDVRVFAILYIDGDVTTLLSPLYQSELIGQWATPHHLSDVRRGAPYSIWDYFSHSDVTICVLNAIYMLYFARSPVRRNWPSSSDCVLFKMFR